MNRSIALRILESYFRHRWLYLAPIALMLTVGLAYVMTKPRQYLTQGLVHVPGESYLATLTAVRADQAGWWVTPAQRTSNEIKELLRTDTFMRSLIAATDLAAGLDTDPLTEKQLIEETRTAVWTVPQGDNQVLIGTQHADPVVAYQLASATIENYTQWRIDAELAQSAVALAFFADLLPLYEAELITARSALDDYLMAHPEPLSGDRSAIEQLEVERLRSTISQAQARYLSAQDKDESARLAASQAEVNVRQSFYVMDAPPIPVEPNTSLRQTALQLGIFMGVGMILAIGAVAGGALLNRGFAFPIDVQASLHLPVLATIPESRMSGPWAPSEKRLAGRRLTYDLIVSPVQAVPALPSGITQPDLDNPPPDGS